MREWQCASQQPGKSASAITYEQVATTRLFIHTANDTCPVEFLCDIAIL